MAELKAPIIIKKITIEEGGAHGGAWKVAYADFVTAMMAFFLLLWLLSSVEKSKLEGIADYFTPTIGLKDAKGIGFDGGQSSMKDGTQVAKLSPMGLIPGSVPQGPTAQAPQEQSLIEGEEESKLFEKGEKSIKKAFESDPNLSEVKDQIVVEQSPEGLKIEVMDSDKNTMFVPGGDTLTPFGRTVLIKMSEVIEKMPNHISLTGHTDAIPYSNNGMTNWELSVARANSSRRFLLSTGMSNQRVAKIVGRADKELLFPQDPNSVKNRRISIILLRGSHMVIPMEEQPASRSLLSVPKLDGVE